MLPSIEQEIAVNPTTIRSRRQFTFIILYVEYISKCKACLIFFIKEKLPSFERIDVI